MMRRAITQRVLGGALALVFVAGCDSVRGDAIIEARFALAECPMGRERSRLEDYIYDADYMATDRFGGILVISLLEYQVQIEETDGLAIRVDLDGLIEEGRLVVDEQRGQIMRADDAPLDIPLREEPGAASAILSLFQTCPDHPGHRATSGRLTFTHFTISEDPQDTGELERIAGTLTATIVRAEAGGPVGTMTAVFDFAPPRRPLATFK